MTLTNITPEQRGARNAHILRLAQRHMHPLKIAKRVPGATPQIVNNVLFQARNGGVDINGRRFKPHKPKGHTIMIPGDIMELLRPAALARKCSVADLAKDLLIAVAEGKIFDAVLDDEVMG